MVLKSCRPVGFIFFILNLDSCQIFLALNRADQTYGQRGAEGLRNCLSVTKNMFYSLISLKIKVIIRFPFDPVNITFKVGISLLSIYFFVLTRFFARVRSSKPLVLTFFKKCTCFTYSKMMRVFQWWSNYTNCIGLNFTAFPTIKMGQCAWSMSHGQSTRVIDCRLGQLNNFWDEVINLNHV